MSADERELHRRKMHPAPVRRNVDRLRVPEQVAHRPEQHQPWQANLA